MRYGAEVAGMESAKDAYEGKGNAGKPRGKRKSKRGHRRHGKRR